MPESHCAAELRRTPLREEVLGGWHLADHGNNGTLNKFLREDRSALTRWFGQVMDAVNPAARQDQLRGMIDRDIDRLDQSIACLLDAILHHSQFQRLEGSWRGFADLLKQADPVSIVIRVLSARWDELARDLERAIEFDQSALFRMLYENEFGHAGGQPFGLLVIDHEVAHKAVPRTLHSGAPIDDVRLLTLLSRIGAAAFLPMVLSAAPRLFGADSFSDLALSHDITSPLEDEDHERWRRLARTEDSRFLCVTMPRVLARSRWSDEHTGGWYDEYAPGEAQRCWCVAGYALAANVMRAHATDRWPADIRGVTVGRIGGGVVTDLTAEPFRFGPATTLPRASTDVVFTDTQERALVAASFVPLNMLAYGEAAFGAVRSLQARTVAETGRRRTPYQANRRVSAELNSILCVSRFAHYLKIIGRAMVGRHAAPADIERELRQWLLGYTNSNQAPDSSSRARYPLLSSQVQVTDALGQPGHYGCIIHLQPFYQLDDVSTTFRLTTNLLPGGVSAMHSAMMTEL